MCAVRGMCFKFLQPILSVFLPALRLLVFQLTRDELQVGRSKWLWQACALYKTTVIGKNIINDKLLGDSIVNEMVETLV
ncbi:hypothetical protein AZ66_25840 [Paenibacillus sp. E194]|nr:hypothetical protein [Paenibacillus sp. E194]KJB85250.1 hypothetical protein AZ66_25840 [Paenibacillus sp. E194]